MRANMHRHFFGQLALILFGGMLFCTVVTVSAQPVDNSMTPGEEVGSKDLGERGRKIIPSLDLYDAELPVVLRAIAKFSGLNIIASDDVEGKVSLYLENVSVQSSLEAILTTNGFAYIHKDNVVYVLPAEKLGEDKVKTVTRVFFLQYLDAAEVEDSLSEVFSGGSGGGGGGGGSSPIAANPSSNSIIITDTPDQVEKIIALLTEIDRPFKQVRIESHLIEVKFGYDKEFGVDWSYFEEGSQADNRADVNLTSLGRDLAMQQAAGFYQFGLVRDGGKTLTGFIQAEQQDNDVKILANPSVTALHNVKAVIRITNDIPYVEANVSQGVITESVNFRETGITLEVTPRINDEGFINMRVKPTQKIAGPRIILQNSNAFPVDERSVETELRVPDTATVVIGGLRSSELNETRQKVPILGDIPLLGAMFKRSLDNIVQSELLLFITPTIVKDFDLSEKEQKKLDEFEKMNKELHKKVLEREQRQLKQEEREANAEKRREERELQRAEKELMQEENKQRPYKPGQWHDVSLDWEGQWAVSASKNNMEQGIAVEGDASLLATP